MNQPQLHADFPTASLNTQRSRVIGRTIHLVGRDQHFPGPKSQWWKWIHFRLSNAKGFQPTFVLNNRFEPGPERLDRHAMWFKQGSGDWQTFSHNDHDADANTFTFSHRLPFAANDVFVAYGLPYPAALTEQHTQQVIANPHAQPAPGADTQGWIGQSTGGTDELRRSFPPQPLWGYRIGRGLRRVVLLSGVHPNEGPGNWALQGLVDWLIDEPQAAVRQAATVDVYPLVNPDGRDAGLNRTPLNRLDLDANRLWRNDLCTQMPEAQQVMQAVGLGLDGHPPDLFIDFHAWCGTPNPFGILSHADGFDQHPFWRVLKALEPDLGTRDSGWGNPSTETWAYQNLRARFCMTLELPFAPPWDAARLMEFGKTVGRALEAWATGAKF